MRHSVQSPPPQAQPSVKPGSGSVDTSPGTKPTSLTPSSKSSRSKSASSATAGAKTVAPKADPLKQMQSTEGLLDKAFLKAPPQAPAPTEAFLPQSGGAEQSTAFAGLLPLIGEPSNKQTSDAFEFPAPSAEAFGHSDLQAALFQQRTMGKALPPSLGHLADVIASNNLQTLTQRIAKLQNAAAAITLSPQIIAQIRAQIVGPLKAQFGLGTDSDDEAADTVPTQLSGNDQGSGSGNGGNGTLDVSSLTKAIAKLQAMPELQGVDLGTLIGAVFLSAAHGSPLDLQDLAVNMQQSLAVTTVLRGLYEQQSTQAAAVKAQVDQEYQALVEEGAIDPKKCSQTTFENARGLVIPAATINTESDPPVATCDAPTLALVNGHDVFQASDVPAAWAPGGSSDTPMPVFTNAQSADPVASGCGALGDWLVATGDQLQSASKDNQKIQMTAQLVNQAYTQVQELVASGTQS